MNSYRKNPELHEKITLLYNEGYLDPQIAEKLEMDKRAIGYIRNNILGLKNIRNNQYLVHSKDFKDLLEKSNLDLVSEDSFYKGAKHKFYKVRCKNCGKEFDKLISSMGKSKCQCTKKDKPAHNSKSLNLISSIYFESCKSNAKSRGREFSVSKQDLWDQWVKQEEKCVLSGILLTLRRNYREKNEMTASLDRIDSSRGYSKDNIQWIHKDINKMKSNYPEEYFIKICKLITEHNKNE